MKRSQVHIYDNYLSGLSQLLEEPLNLDPERPLGAICRQLFSDNSGPGPPLEGRERRPVLIYDKRLEKDEDKLRVLGGFFGLPLCDTSPC